MPIKSNFDEIKNTFSNLYKNKYDYTKSVYINNRTKICVICPIHGEFYVKPYNHLRGSECPSCKSNLNMDNKSFLNKSKIVHGNLYDYSLVSYINNKTKVKIICNKHKNIFEQRPNDHLLGQGCPICKKEKLSKLNKYTDKIFIEKSKKIHGNLYDYSLIEYKGIDNKVKIICKEHGIFEQTPKNHINGQGCSKCKNKNKRLLKEQFIDISNKIHNNKYDYSLTDYKNNKTKVKIICPIHGEFKQIPLIHMNGSGCSKCNTSMGEKIILTYLNKNNISYNYQKKFKGCYYKKLLVFDFYLPEYNLVIEFDGEQHFKVNEFFGGIKEFNKLKEKDKIKNNFCEKNNINILRIPFNELNNIEQILNNNINN